MSNRAVDAETAPAPDWSQALGYAGLIPFLAGAAALTAIAMTLRDVALAAAISSAVIVYGAVILSFLGGVRWGVAVARGDADGRVFALSVVPSLIGWGAALLPAPWALLVLAAGFMLQGAWDVKTASEGGLPAWYARLRRHLTVIVAASLLVSAASVLLVEVART
ncbi:DUF3429 domain-containing protein [Stappia sp.]|uniref:DUF3429 domain-containing protein n=1 Tax=Stappia sp. TaxID=1870903 RepID=UPI0032D99DD8